MSTLLLLLYCVASVLSDSQLYTERIDHRNLSSLSVKTDQLPSIVLWYRGHSPLVNSETLAVQYEVRNLSKVLADEHRVCTSVWLCSLSTSACLGDDDFDLLAVNPSYSKIYTGESKVNLRSFPIEFASEFSGQYRLRAVLEIQAGFNCTETPARSSAVRQFMDEATLSQGTFEAPSVSWWWNKQEAASLDSSVGLLYYRTVQLAMSRAFGGKSRLTETELSLFGMSGQQFRHFYNSLASLLPSVRYLEIGIFSGSTMLSLLKGNGDKVKAVVGIDQWGEDEEGWAALTPFGSFQAARDSFMALLPRYVDESQYIQILEESCWSVSSQRLIRLMGEQRFNLFMYDGRHQVDDQFFALANFLPALADTFIWVVDDWNHADARIGTEAALVALRDSVVVLGKLELSTKAHPLGPSDWHNGVAVFVIQKRVEAQVVSPI